MNWGPKKSGQARRSATMRALHFILPVVLLMATGRGWAANERDLDFDWMMGNVDKLLKSFIPTIVLNLSANDGDGSGINDDDALGAFAVIMRNNVVTYNRVGTNAADAAQMRADFVNNRNYLDLDMNVYDKFLQFDCTLLKAAGLLHIAGANIPDCKLTTMLKADEALGQTVGPFINNILLDLFAGMVETGDWTGMETYLNTILGSLIHELLVSVNQTGFESNLQDLKINDNSYSSAIGSGQYARWGATPGGPAGYTRVNRFGSAGDLDGDGTTNATEYATAGRDREAFLRSNSLGVYSSQTTDQPIHFAMEEVSNGSFSGSATGWTLGSGWSYGTNVLTGTTTTASATQSLSGATVGKYYAIRYTISTLTAGSVRVSLGTANGTTQTAAGTYTQVLKATGSTTLGFTGVTAFSGTIDNVTVRETPPSDVFTAGTSITFAPGYYAGNAAPLTFKWEDAQDFGDQNSPNAAASYGLSNITDGGVISGASTNSLTISNLAYASHDGMRPWLRASDQVTVYNDYPVGGGTTSGSVEADARGGRTSLYGRIFVAETLPRGPITDVCSGSVLLTAYASSVDDSTDGDTTADAPTYQWYYGATAGTLAAIGGQTASTYTFTASGPAEGYYACDTTVYIDGAFKTTRTNVVFYDFPATPGTPSVPDMAAGSDSGSSNADNLTNVTTPTFTGTADAFATVTLVIDSVNNNSTVADASGNWSVASTALGNGGHTIAAFASNCAGTGSTSSALNITIDTIAPAAPSQPDLASASDSGSSNADDITNITLPQLSGTAEAGATISVTSSINGGIGTSVGPNWAITVASALSNGTHSVSAVATDAAGNISSGSTALSLVIDTVAPAAPTTPDLTAAKDSGSSNTDNITNINNPSFTGTAEASAIVKVYSDLAGQIATGAGASYTANSGSIAAATHQISATATDAAGNTSGSSGVLTLVIDQTAPAAPPAPDLNAASDSGSSSTDNITNVTLPSFSGTAEVNSTVTLLVDSVANGTIGAGGGGSYATLTAVSALAQGIRIISATATDVAGNTSAAGTTLSVTIDTTAPAAPGLPDLLPASDSGVSSTDNITNDSTPDLSGSAEAGATVTVTSSVDGVVGSATATGGTWNLTPALTENVHNITVTARDAAGNTGTASSALSLTIDLTAPAAPGTPDLVAGSDTGTSNSDDITNDTTPDITGTAINGNSVVVISSISGTMGTVTASGGNYSLTSSAIAAGSHTITAKQTDPAGNQSASSGSLSITVDTTAPTITGQVPTAGTTLATLPSVDVSTSEAVSGLTAGKLTVNGSAATGVSGTNPYTFTGYTVPGGNLTLTIVVTVSGVTDTAGNALSSTGNSWTYDKNASIPSVALTASISNGGVTNGATVNYTATFSESVQNFVVGDLSLSNCSPSAFAGGPTVYTFTITPTAEGTVSVTVPAAVCTGVALPAGRNNTASGTYSYTYDVTAPTVTVATLSTANDRPALSGTVVGDPLAAISVTVASQTKVATNNGNGTWSLAANQLSTLADGTYNVTVTATDAAGNVGTDSTTNELTIDTTAPTVTVDPLATNDNTPALSGTVNDGFAAITVQVGSQLVSATNNGTTWSLADNTLTTLTDGTYNVVVTATDTLGNIGTDATVGELIIDATAPALTADTLLTADNTPELTGTINDPTAAVVVTVDSQVLAATNNGDGTWTLADDQLTSLADGNFEVAVSATDTLGNTGADSTTSELTVDTTGPVITITGLASVTVSCGVGYTDQGASALDARQGSVTVDIVAGGDTIGILTPPGTYSITYDVADSLGNDAVQAVRSVTVTADCPLSVDVNATNVVKLEGESYTFSALANNALGSVALQWQKDDGSKTWQDIGAPGADLTLAILALSDTGLYRCEAVDAVTTAYSAEVSLTVNASANVPVAGIAGLGIASLLAAISGAVAARRKR